MDNEYKTRKEQIEEQLSEFDKAWEKFCNVLKTEKPTSYIYNFIICVLDWLNNKLNK